MPWSKLQKPRLYLGAIVVLLALIGAGAVGWSKTRDELQSVREANTTLRNLLGDMTKAVNKKDQEIERLSQLSCNGAEPKTDDGKNQRASVR